MPIFSFCLTVWIRGHAVIHRHNTPAYFSTAVQQECGLLKAQRSREAVRTHRRSKTITLGTRAHSSRSDRLRPVHWGQQLGLYPPTLLTFKDVIVCRTCSPYTSALMACFSLWQPQRASTARLVIILIWSALLGNLSTYFPSFYTPVSLLSFFCIPLA